MAFGNVTIGDEVGLIDATTWATAGTLRSNKTTTAQGTEFMFDLQLTIGNTGAGASYEKGAIISRAKTSDPSGANTYDAVGIDSRGLIAAGNSAGRVWGGYFEANIASTGDGLAQGVEAVVSNSGTDQGTAGTTTSKYCVHTVASGSQPVTAGLYMEGSGSTYHYGILMPQAAVTAGGLFLDYGPGLIQIGRTGQMSIGTTVNQSGTTQLKVNGSIAVGKTNIALGTTNNDVSIGSGGFVRTSGPTGAYSVSGFTGGEDGRELEVHFFSGATLTLKHQSGSLAGNQIFILSLADLTFAASSVVVARFKWTADLNSWLLMSARDKVGPK